MSKIKKKTSYYVNGFWNFFLYSLFFLIFSCVTFVGFIILRILLVHIFRVEKAVGNLVSIIVSIVIFLIPFIPKMKYGYIKIINIIRQKIYLLQRKKNLIYDINITTEQANIINKALAVLQGENVNLLAVESEAGKGKTMTTVFLLDNIGTDSNLIELFIQFQKHIFYIDAGYEQHFLMEFLSNQTVATSSLIIIDNLHKLTAEVLDKIFKEIKNISEYSRATKRKTLFILLYQTAHKDESTGNLLKKYMNQNFANSYESFYNLNNARINLGNIHPTLKIDPDGTILRKIKLEQCDLLRTQLLNIYTSSSDIEFLFLLLNSLDKQNDNNKKLSSEFLQMIAIITLLSKYLGFVSEKHIINLWINCLCKKRKTHCKYLINYLSNHCFMTPFPLISKAFLFNEQLACEYRKKLFIFNEFKNCYYDCAEYLYNNKVIDNPALKWLFLISCRTEYCKAIPSDVKEKHFYLCTDKLNRDYVLGAMKEEIEIDSSKKELLKKELGTIYIITGRWTQARNLIKPYIVAATQSSEILQLQLKIIEADHGVNESENLSILNSIKNLNCDTYIRFQARYWYAHISMELGDFSLSPWEDLMSDIKENLIWQDNSEYPHLIHRITADTCRTLFLRGGVEPVLFNKTIKFFLKFRQAPLLQDDLALEKLEHAHYIHYELVYQLGIWQMYCFKHDKKMSYNDSFEKQELVEEALHLYDESINIFKKAGNKTYRTAQIRRDELSICSISPNFVEILSHLDEFDEFAHENRVDAFVGYVECLRGKEFAAYALSQNIGQNDASYERYIDLAIEALQKSIEIYNHYGNEFGSLRSQLLKILIKTLKELAIGEEPLQVIQTLKEKLLIIKTQFLPTNIREEQIIQFLSNSSELCISDIISVVKHYPIVLQ